MEVGLGTVLTVPPLVVLPLALALALALVPLQVVPPVLRRVALLAIAQRRPQLVNPLVNLMAEEEASTAILNMLCATAPPPPLLSRLLPLRLPQLLWLLPQCHTYPLKRPLP